MLSAGFVSVAVEDSTLLDAAIAMLDELGYAYEQSSSHEVKDASITMLKKLYSVMSDRSSVNKAFNTKLNNKRKQ